MSKLFWFDLEVLRFWNNFVLSSFGFHFLLSLDLCFSFGLLLFLLIGWLEWVADVLERVAKVIVSFLGRGSFSSDKRHVDPTMNLPIPVSSLSSWWQSLNLGILLNAGLVHSANLSHGSTVINLASWLLTHN